MFRRSIHPVRETRQQVPTIDHVRTRRRRDRDKSPCLAVQHLQPAHAILEQDGNQAPIGVQSRADVVPLRVSVLLGGALLRLPEVMDEPTMPPSVAQSSRGSSPYLVLGPLQSAPRRSTPDLRLDIVVGCPARGLETYQAVLRSLLRPYRNTMVRCFVLDESGRD
ncbi:hypothetical protein VTO42DRAFT_2710 [Malbranchea cinnamomea]